MSFVRLSEIPRTTSFRTGLLFLLLFGVTSLALFGYIYSATSGYLTKRVDLGLKRQIAVYRALEPATLIKEIGEHGATDPAGRQPYGVFSAGGAHLAGLLALPPAEVTTDAAFEFIRINPKGKLRATRGLAYRFASGELLVVSEDIHDLREFNELLVRAMESGGVIMLVVGLAGALAMGWGARRRMDAVASAIERIVKGDLSERLPTRGTQDDVDRLSVVVNRMLDELERLMSEVKGVCDDVAHDLRTPLTRLLAGLERAQRRAATADDYAKAVSQAITEAHELLVTFRALLRISEIEVGARRREFVNVDLQRVAQDAVELFEPLADEKGISLGFRGGAQAVCMVGDAHLLFDAVCNLVDNALKFTPAQGRVVVQVSRTADEIELIVRDSGLGIPEEEHEAVFRRFYRSERSRNAPGNGLGLSLVLAVAKLHDLTVSIRDASPGCVIALKGRAAGMAAHAQAK